MISEVVRSLRSTGNSVQEETYSTAGFANFTVEGGVGIENHAILEAVRTEVMFYDDRLASEDALLLSGIYLSLRMRFAHAPRVLRPFPSIGKFFEGVSFSRRHLDDSW